jgi:glycosyltransferase involved in cell wall biosynthesis
MRIAFDARSLASPVLRGWDRYTVGLVRALVERGVRVSLFHRARQPLHAPHVTGLGAEVVGLDDRGGLHYEQVAVPRALRRGRFDLFHAPAEHGVPLGAPCPVVLTIHSVTHRSYADLIRRGLLKGEIADYLGAPPASPWRLASLYMGWQPHRASHILTPSEFCRAEVIRLLRVAPRRVTCTPLAVHEQFERPPRPEPARAATLARLGVRKPYVLYVGGYEAHKNVGGLLDAFAMVRAARSELALVLVGSKALPDATRAHAERLGLAPGHDVVFLVNLTDELTDLYDDAALLATLSWRETFGLPALEALARGVPVVASAWGAAREVVGDAGRLVDPRDPAAARDAILALLAEPDREALRARAHQRAQCFSWDLTANRTMAVYEMLLDRRAAGRRLVGRREKREDRTEARRQKTEGEGRSQETEAPVQRMSMLTIDNFSNFHFLLSS